MGGTDQKLEAIRLLMDQRGLDLMLLRRYSSFAWATDGAASYINTASSTGEATLAISRTGKYLVTNKIEAPRLEKEEKLAEQGWEFIVGDWFEPDPAFSKLTKDKRIGSDLAGSGEVDVSSEMARLRANLTPEEGRRFRILGKACADAMDSACRNIEPGMSEYEIAAILSAESQKRAAQPIVVLIAVDERIFSFRHPLPTEKKLKNYAMLVLCGRWKGLICSITRFVHFGPLNPELRAKSDACVRVDANVLAATRPGNSIQLVFDTLRKAYAEVGYPEEWRLHHQGGPAGYETREFIGTPSTTDVVQKGQVYAWNPSITGIKVEDSILVGEESNEILTEIPDWPVIEVKSFDGKIWKRPDILVR